MALLLFGQQSNGRLTETVRSSALPRVHAICTCRGTGYARDGMPEGFRNEKRSISSEVRQRGWLRRRRMLGPVHFRGRCIISR
jgi:hypothetical protein